MKSNDVSTQLRMQTGTTVPADYRCPPTVLLGMCMGVAIYWLFALSMGALLPAMSQTLNVSVPDLGLPMALAGLVAGIFIVPAGGLADRLGRLKFTRIGMVAGLLGMLLCGLANSAEMLIAGRFMQGLSAALVMPATLALVKVYYNDAERPRAISYWAMSTFGCASVSSILGGIVATTLGWRWVFFLAIPFILVAFWLLRNAPESKVAHAAHQSFDWIGLATLVVGLLGINLFVSKGNAWGWSSPMAIGALAVFVVMLPLFILQERRHGAPIADLSLFNSRIYTGVVSANFFINSLLGLLVILLTYLQKGRGLSPLNAALLTLSYTATVLTFIRVGEHMAKKGTRLPMVLGGVSMAIASILLAMTHFNENLHYFIIAFFGMGFMGTGLGLFATPATTASVGEAPADKAGAAGGIFKMASSLGGAMGIAIHMAVYGSVLANHGSVHQAAAYALGIGVIASVIAAALAFVFVPAAAKTAK